MSREIPNLIWQGRVHIGDDPGKYGDACYAGLAVEFPIELIPYSADGSLQGQVTLVLEAEGIEAGRGYPGHLVTVTAITTQTDGLTAAPSEALAKGRFAADTAGLLRFTLSGSIPRYVVVAVRADTAIAPGLYMEVVIRRLSILSSTHFAYLGYRAGRAH